MQNLPEFRALQKGGTIPSKPFKFYLGIDATADRLHVGHYYMLRIAKSLIDVGNTGYILIGTKTAMIGDPTGRSTQRKIKSAETVYENAQKLKEQVANVLPEAFITEQPTTFLENLLGKVSVKWLTNLSLFAERLTSDQPLSLLELCYPLYQALDFIHLNSAFGISLQIGGQDQWANMALGLKFTEDCGVITFPLLTNKGGEKISKTTTKNLLGADSDPWEVWQYFRNITDDKVREVFDKVDDVNMLKEFFAVHMVAFIFDLSTADMMRTKARKKYQKYD